MGWSEIEQWAWKRCVEDDGDKDSVPDEDIMRAWLKKNKQFYPKFKLLKGDK